MSATIVEIPLQISFDNRPLTTTQALGSSAAASLKGACAVNFVQTENGLTPRAPIVNVTSPKGTLTNIFSDDPSEMYSITTGGTIWYTGSAGGFVNVGTVSLPLATYGFASSPLPGNAVLVTSTPSAGYSRNGGAFAAIVDANFVTLNLIPYVICLDGTYYVCTTNASIYGSNLNDGTTWSALNRVNAWQDGGTAVAFFKHRNYAVVLKTGSMQVFYDAGNPVGSPLLPLLTAQQPVGCPLGNGQSLVEIRGDHFWVAQAKDNALFVAQMSNLQISPVSTPAINRWLAWAYKQTEFSAFEMSCWGKSFYVLYALSLTTAYAMVYDIADKTWAPWDMPLFTRGLVQSVFGPGFSGGLFSDMYYLNQDSGSGLVYRVVDFPYVNGGTVSVPWADQVTVGGTKQSIASQFTTAIVDGGTQAEKTAMRLEIFSDYTDNGILEIAWSDDDYKSWSPYTQVVLNDARVFMDDLGVFRRRAFRFRHIGPTPLRIQSIKLQVLLGAS